jgi:hypothetical protein
MESDVIIETFPTTGADTRRGRIIAAAVGALLAGTLPTHAGGSFAGSCTGSGASFVCAVQTGGNDGNFPQIVRLAPPTGERDLAESVERERRWLSRCRPLIRYDRYGVGRYAYAAEGCEFGRSSD